MIAPAECPITVMGVGSIRPPARRAASAAGVGGLPVEAGAQVVAARLADPRLSIRSDATPRAARAAAIAEAISELLAPHVRVAVEGRSR